MQVIATKLGRSTPFHDPVTIFQSRDCKPLVTKLAKVPHTLVPTPQLHMYAGYVVKNVCMIVTWHHDVTDKRPIWPGDGGNSLFAGKLDGNTVLWTTSGWVTIVASRECQKLIFRWRSPFVSNRTTIVRLNPIACQVWIKGELVILPFVCFSK